MMINPLFRGLGRIAQVCVVASISAAPALADPVADFYKDKTISLIISTGVGGGYDRTARALARYLTKYVPGNPTVVPKNMPGAGNVLAANYMANVAPKDGTT